MKAYYTYFKLKFISGLQYRAAAWAGIATQFFFGFVYVMVYIAFYESKGTSVPMELSQVITYLWLNQAFLALLNQYTMDSDIIKLMKDGGISYELTRPKELYYMWYFKIIGGRLASVTLRFIPIILVTSLLPAPYNFGLPASFPHFLLFLLSLILGALLVTALAVLYPIITIITMNEKGLASIMMSIGDILSGLGVPIPFFPHFLQIISRYLPFQYISDLPFRIYTGHLSLENGLQGMLIQLIWLFIIINLGHFLLNKQLRKVVVQGG